MESTQSNIVKSAESKGYNNFHTDWFKNNKLNSKTWFLECCLLQKWLRETHCLDVFVVPAIKENHYEYLIYIEEDIIVADEAFVRYEDALEIGLQKALKLIKD